MTASFQQIAFSVLATLVSSGLVIAAAIGPAIPFA